jgi:hypothetical protein
MKIKSLLTASALIAASLAIVAPAPASASECSAADPCGVWSMLDANGTITNNIVCQPSVCGGGEWAGQRVVPQAAPNPVTHDTTGRGGYWGTYDEVTALLLSQKSLMEFALKFHAHLMLTHSDTKIRFKLALNTIQIF